MAFSISKKKPKLSPGCIMIRLLSACVVFAFVMALGDYSNVAQAQAPEKKEEIAEKKIAVEDPAPFELIYGEANAPVTIVEYASLSCSHCGAFYKTVFGALKEKYVDTGKVRFIYRHFPLNLSALKAAMLVACAPEGKKHNFINVLFKTQDDWAFEREFEQKLKTIATLGGINEETFSACMSDQPVEDNLVTSRLLAARQLDVSSTPTFFINGKKFEGERTIAAFMQEIDPLLPEVKIAPPAAPADTVTPEAIPDKETPKKEVGETVVPEVKPAETTTPTETPAE